MINCFEHTPLRFNKLPKKWQENGALIELESFLRQNWDQREVFYNDEKISTEQQFLTVYNNRVETNNYIGTIVFKGEQLNIFPKVFKAFKGDNDIESLDLNHLMLNIVKWIEYCHKVDYPYVNIKSEIQDVQDLKDLFITVYIKYLKATLERSLYYQYTEMDEDINVIKGRVDFKNYFCKKIPSGNYDKFLCSFSNFEFDNLLNRIIKYTCKLIYHECSNIKQKEIRDILVKLNEVSDVKCVPSDCDSIRLSKSNSHYKIILSMCKIFLLNKTTSYNIDENESFCFLFPSELLFEGFIGGFIQTTLSDSKNISVKLQAADEYLISNVVYNGEDYGSTIKMRHDILISKDNKCVFILDTKYKELNRFENFKISKIQDIGSSDIYQMLAYAIRRGIDKIFLLYPLFRFEDVEPNNPILKVDFSLEENKYSVDVHVLRVPFVFEKDNTFTKDKLSKIILDILE